MSIPFAHVSFPEIYERALVGPLFRPFVELMLEDLNLRPGERVLDVACGTGIAARLARERVGPKTQVVGVDVNPGMLAVARAAAPDVDWREGDSAALPLRQDEQFDVVVCHQGFQFFADRAAAAGEMARALAPGGRIAIATWRPDDEVPLGRALRLVAERHVGPIDDRRHSLGHPEPTESVLSDSGFRDIRSTVRTHTVRFDDGLVFVRLNATALIGMSANTKSLDEAERQRLVDIVTQDSMDVLRSYTAEGGLAYELGTNVTTARK